MPKLPETIDTRVLNLEQQQLATNAMDKQQNQRLEALEELVFTLQAELARLQACLPQDKQLKPSAEAVDKGGKLTPL